MNSRITFRLSDTIVMSILHTVELVVCFHPRSFVIDSFDSIYPKVFAMENHNFDKNSLPHPASSDHTHHTRHFQYPW